MQARKDKLSNRKLFISCVVPVFNEEKNIERFTNELSHYLNQYTDLFEIILVDDGSTDNTSSIIHTHLISKHIKWIQFSRNFGKEIALTAGLNYAKGDVVVLIDADFQHTFSTINEFIQKWLEGYDMVYAVRSNRDDESYLKSHTSRAFYKLMNLVSQVNLPIDAGDFRLLDRKLVSVLNRFGEYKRFMKGLYATLGFKSIGVPYEVAHRAEGNSSFNARKLLGLALTGITSFSNLPLRIWSVIGATISGISLIYALCIIIDTLTHGTHSPGYPTVMVCILFLGGIQLLSIGILGEYIGRIFEEVKKRPLYIIADSHGFDGPGSP